MQTAALVRSAGITPLGTVNGNRVVLAEVQGSCICGNVNCPYYVLRLGPAGAAGVLLSTFAYQVTPAGPAAPLPNLRELAHDSALISVETVDAFRGGKYVVIATARVRGDTGERKPDGVPVRFAPGTSSATLHGSVSEGWYDQYALDAAQGQHVTISGPSSLSYSLIRRGAQSSIALKPGVPAALPASGSYLLQIDGGGEARTAYTATITIR